MVSGFGPRIYLTPRLPNLVHLSIIGVEGFGTVLQTQQILLANAPTLRSFTFGIFLGPKSDLLRVKTKSLKQQYANQFGFTLSSVEQLLELTIFTALEKASLEELTLERVGLTKSMATSINAERLRTLSLGGCSNSKEFLAELNTKNLQLASCEFSFAYGERDAYDEFLRSLTCQICRLKYFVDKAWNSALRHGPFPFPYDILERYAPHLTHLAMVAWVSGGNVEFYDEFNIKNLLTPTYHPFSMFASLRELLLSGNMEMPVLEHISLG
ncbi:hypothetical protein ABW19_dt0207694 [Dactylella cylindrospora]|nr:hypothetical protein ABW19_dt0207694 [Dactylella cylindrospora]